jgi:hypothetical protein
MAEIRHHDDLLALSCAKRSSTLTATALFRNDRG